MIGWVKLHRKIRNNPIFNDLQLFRLMVICLTESTHKDHEQLVGSQVVKLHPGQFVTGRFALHDMYNQGLKPKERVAEKTVWRWLEKLEKLDFLTINSTNKYSIVTVNNWDIYQQVDQQNDQQMTNKRPTNDHQMTTNKNGKNVKNGENEKNNNYNNTHSRSVEFFVNNFGQFSPFVSDSITAWENDLNPDLVIAAMKIALKRNKKNFGYVEPILQEWHAEGISSLDQARAYESNKWEKPKKSHENMRHPKRRNKREEILPKWMNGEPIVMDKAQEEVEQRAKELETFLNSL